MFGKSERRAHWEIVGDSTKLMMALLACLLGYGEVGLWLKKEAAKENPWVIYEDNPYKKWIDDYSGPDYQQAVRLGLGKVWFWIYLESL